jgi:hypothetical protein
MKRKKILKFLHNNIPKRFRTFTLGELYVVTVSKLDTRCQFIKVTRKGFNLLDLDTSKCILKHHLYDSKYSGKDIPRYEINFTVRIPNWIYKITNEKQSNCG